MSKKKTVSNPEELNEVKKFQAKIAQKIEEESTNPKEDKLTLKQEEFCQLYATDREFFGNGVQAYIEVYEPDMSKPNWYKSACSSAARLLSNVKVINRINEILEKTGFNEVDVDKQLSFLIHQHADFNSKLGAIREFNKLKKRVTDKLDLTSGGLPITVVSYQELQKKQNE